MNIMGDLKRKITLVAFMMLTIVSLGLSSNTAFAGNAVEEPDPQPCEVHFAWTSPFFDTPQSPISASFTGCLAATGFSDINPTLFCTSPIIIGVNDFDDGSLNCTAEIPNWIDELDTKIIFIDIAHPGSQFIFPETVTVIPFDRNDPSASCETIVAEISDEDPSVFIYDIECHPNPDFEQIQFVMPTDATSVKFWTESFNAQVGGMPIPIDSTALILAGAQSISMWMIPVVIAGVGIGVFVIKRRN